MALMNCEIYVLNRLQKLEGENENLKENLQELTKTAEELKKLKETLIKQGQIKTYSYSGKQYIYIGSIECDSYNREERDAFDFLTSIIDFKNGEDQEENQEEVKEGDQAYDDI